MTHVGTALLLTRLPSDEEVGAWFKAVDEDQFAEPFTFVIDMQGT